jgi:hypothetical protein
MTQAAIGQLDHNLRGIDQRIATYKNRRVTDLQAHDLIIKAVDADAITNSQIPEVIDQWREPNHECFKQRNAWSLFNAFTEATKKVNPHTQIRRGEALQRLFDAKYDLALPC